MQYKCEQDNDTLNEKREKGLAVAALTCLCGLIFLVTIFYLKRTSGLDFQKWDLDTLTAGDFTIEITVSDEMWTQFNVQLGTHAQLPRGQAAPNHTDVGLPVVTFEAFMEAKICEKLNALPKVTKSWKQEDKIKIANITFGFDNPKLLALLTERGSLVSGGKLEKVPAVNEKIQELIKENKTELIRPVAAFITFDSQEGKERAQYYFPDPKDKTDYEPLDVKSPEE